MIRDPDAKGFLPGSAIPTVTEDDVVLPEDVMAYVTSDAWEHGKGVLLVGPPGCGKTTLGLSILRQMFAASPKFDPYYWTEADFLSDLRNVWRLEEMVQRHSDHGIWGEYLDWERAFWEIKECGYLFLDDLCRSYTPMQWYEIEGLVRSRLSRNLPTMLAVSTGRWDGTSDDMKSVMQRNNLLVRMAAL